MALNSWGYNGKLTDIAWARMAPLLGYGRYVVQSPQAWQVVPNPAVDRGLIVKAGVGWGDGVLDELTADLALPSIPAPASGSRTYAIVARRDWTAKATTFQAITNAAVGADGQTGAAFSTAGVKADQVIALAAVTAGSTVVTPISDRRCWAEGPRTLFGYRPAPGALAARVVSSLTELTDQARAGEYVLRGDATLDTNASGAIGGTNLRVSGVELGGKPANLLAKSVVDLRLGRRYVHLGGELAVSFTLFVPVDWAGATVRTGAEISATWVGPVP